MKIGIIDYGSGNLHSVHNAVRHAASSCSPDDDILRVTTAGELAACDRIILPGVGHFADCFAGLSGVDGMIDTLTELVREKGRPFLGICVGMQLLADTGTEGGQTIAGLGWIPGQVTHLANLVSISQAAQLKIPHMGWNHLHLHQPEHAVLAELPAQTQVYFVHSFMFQLAQPSDCLASASYGVDIPAVIGRDNILATQFHPEKSQQAGQAFLQGFLRWRP